MKFTKTTQRIKVPCNSTMWKRIDWVALEKPWKQHSGEPSTTYALFKEFLSMPVYERTLAAFQRKHHPEMSYRAVLAISTIYGWGLRAEMYQRHINQQSIEKMTEQNVDYLTRAQTATQKLVAILAEKATAALESNDDETFQKITHKLKPFTSLLTGSGKLGEFLLDAHKTFHGTRQQVDMNAQTQILHWGI